MAAAARIVRPATTIPIPIVLQPLTTGASTTTSLLSHITPPATPQLNEARKRAVLAQSHVTPLDGKSMNARVYATEYAVRGEIVLAAEQLRRTIAEKPDSHGLPFNEVISCNIGNPQELKQKPITFFRQVLSLCHYRDVLQHEGARAAFAPDAIARADRYLTAVPGGTGAYSNSQGLKPVRDEVANFIAARDGHPADADDIFLTGGASVAVKLMLQLIIRDENDGVLIPIPQYPLYSASLTLFGGSQVGYFLNEANGWGSDISEFERAIKDAKRKGINVRALVVINPGNPTGQVLSEKNMQQIIELCEQERLMLMADEVYQTNIYSTTPFVSFKKVVRDMQSKVQLCSFHSVSKGFLGECGQRGGYMELTNFHADIRALIYKMASVNLCANLSGQIMVGLMCNPPKQGDASYEQYTSERDTILQSLKRRAVKFVETINKFPGFKCNPVEGAMYAFPQITLPAKFIEYARQQNRQPDVLYCLKLLEQTGIVVVPGSGFGQEKDTWHFRTTILPPEEKFESLLARFETFHTKLLAEFA